MAPLLETNATLFCCIGTRQPANPFSVFDIDVWEKGGEYFLVSICPSQVYMLQARTEGKDQAFINVQNNIATSHKEDPSRGFEMIKAKMNIKVDDWHARRTASATRQVHPPSKENSKCYQQAHHPSKENAKCYQQRVSPSTSQESSISEPPFLALQGAKEVWNFKCYRVDRAFEIGVRNGYGGASSPRCTYQPEIISIIRIKPSRIFNT
jgi:hypothetical protein